MSTAHFSKRSFRPWRRAGVLTLVASVATALVVLVPGAIGSGNAGYTTFNPDTGGCLEPSSNGVNCNNYDSKDAVYINGGPSNGSGLDPGDYYFAVLAPGFQHDGFIDGHNGNLSDTTPSNGGPGGGDLAPANRTLTVSGGQATSYWGPHFQCDSNTVNDPASCTTSGDPRGQGILIQLSPYDDTPNNGGVYILAICKVGATSPKDCKFDAFRINSTEANAAFDLTVSKDAAPSFTRTYKWKISKKVTSQSTVNTAGDATFDYEVDLDQADPPYVDSDWAVTGTITVTNPNDEPVSGVSVDDAVDNGATCYAWDAGTSSYDLSFPLNGQIVAAKSALEIPYQCTYSSAPAPNAGTNTATATWPNIGSPHTSDSAAAAFTFDDGSAGNPTEQDKTVTVTDSLAGSLGTATVGVDTFPKAFTYPHIFSGDQAGTCTPHDNTATIVETGQTAGQTVHVCVGADLQVSKTASPAFKRTYHWGITKDVDKTLVEQIGGTATFTYTVKVTHDSGVDSYWRVTGTIHVSNPNDWEAITADVSDVVDNGGICNVTGGTAVSVPASGSVDLPYSCTYSSAPSPSAGTNTVTGKWDKDAYSTPTGTSTGTATVDFGTTTPTIVDGSVTVTDSFNGGTPTSVGTASYTDPSPKTFPSYPRTVNVPATNCVFRSNTAKFTTNTTNATGTASQTVEVCGPARTGALTMGYWQNKNGQGIISAANQPKLSSWLMNYNPFSDAPSSNLAGYVYNIIKVATCSGPSTAPCNAMLRAQMLATALNVYFSDPALGANKINAPAPPIGGKSIDLARICKMIDNSNGTGSCSGSYQDASSAFAPGSYADGAGTCPAAVLQLNGTKPMTVLCMLANAASNSAPAGIPWYGTVKATQVLAKDAFDAINNQVVFLP